MRPAPVGDGPRKERAQDRHRLVRLRRRLDPDTEPRHRAPDYRPIRPALATDVWGRVRFGDDNPVDPRHAQGVGHGQRPQVARQQRQDVPRLQVRQKLLQKRLMGVRRHRTDQRLRPGQRLRRVGRHRRQPRRPRPRRPVEVDRQRLPDRRDGVREVGMLPQQHLVPRQRQIRRDAEGGIAPAKDRDSVSTRAHVTPAALRNPGCSSPSALHGSSIEHASRSGNSPGP
ncbi:MAG: hypothetical protein K0S78_543 [Thermomicrobiales bacterium]|nr:hypothetical protein [Thermomicrobiales bacterium]